MNNNEKQIGTFKLLKRLFKYIAPYKMAYILSLFIGLIAIVLDLAGPLILSRVVNLFTKGMPKVSDIVIYAVIYLVFAVLISGALSIIQKMILLKIGQKVIFKLREEIFDNIMAMSHSEFNSIPTGKLITRITGDTQSINELFTKTLTTIIRNFLTLVAAMIFMISISAKLSLVILVVTPILIIITVFFATYSKHKYRSVREHQTNLNTFIAENIDGVRVVKAYSRENAQRKKFLNLNKKVMKSNLEQTIVFAIFRPLIYSIHLACVLLLLYYGGLLALDGSIAPGVIIAFYSYTSYYFDPIQEIAEQLNSMSDSLSSCEKIFNLLDIKSSVVLDGKNIHIDGFKGKIEFRHVYFRYNNKQDYILNDMSFEINAGETIALVGPTGGGKSTIINLIERNYDIESGEILIDDINIKDINISDLRRTIGVMLQDVHLFSGSIYENISLFDRNISREDVISASELVSADSVILKNECGYDAVVLEKGENFSQGERQLISFARAIASRPSMMILDEATANIDSKTEAIIQSSLNKIKNLGTMIIVAHRLSTIKHANRIFVINHGRIEESGNHSELMKKKGMYYNLYLSQYKS